MGIMRLLVVLLVALSMPLAAGCGGDDNGGDEGGATGGTTAGQTVQVSAVDFRFDPPDLSADPGQISIELTNDGEAPHAIEVEGNGVEEESDTIDPGASTTLDLDLEEGTYEIYCPVDGHKDRGMVGTLTVGAGSSGAGATTEDHTETEHEDTTTGDDETTTEDEGEDDNSGSGGGAGSGY